MSPESSLLQLSWSLFCLGWASVPCCSVALSSLIIISMLIYSPVLFCHVQILCMCCCVAMHLLSLHHLSKCHILSVVKDHQCPVTLVLLSENQFMSGLTLSSYTFPPVCRQAMALTIHVYNTGKWPFRLCEVGCGWVKPQWYALGQPEAGQPHEQCARVQNHTYESHFRFDIKSEVLV